MPQKRVAEFIPNAPEDVEDLYFEAESREKPQTAHDKSFESVLDELNNYDGEAYLHVHRQTGNGQEAMEAIGVYSVDEFSSVDDLLMNVRDQYGGGAYRMKLFCKGQRGCKANKLYKVAEPIRKRTTNTQNNESPALLSAVQAMQDQIAQQNQAIMQFLRQPQQGGSRKEMLEEFALIAQIVGGNKGGGQERGIGDIARDITALKDVAPMLGFAPGGGVEKSEGDDDSLIGLVREMAPVLTTALSNNPQQAQQPTQDPKMMRLMKLKGDIQTLLKGAKRNSDPANYAALIVDQFDDATISGFVSSPAMIKQAIQLVPEVADYATWFDTLIEHVKAQCGMESKVGDLYEAEENGINSSNTDTGESADVEQTNVQTGGATQRQSGDTQDAENDGGNIA